MNRIYFIGSAETKLRGLSPINPPAPADTGERNVSNPLSKSLATGWTNYLRIVLIEVPSAKVKDTDFKLCFLELLHYINPKTNEREEIRILAALAPDWKKAARLLGISSADISTIESLGMGKTSHACMMDVFKCWEDNGCQMPNYSTYPETWRGIQNMLRNTAHGKLAKQLEVALDADISNIRGTYSEGIY